ncbi:hypothetical protein ANN_08426 [Periplaneta americana]|uniref:Uncharacterized protein n=1 Tax=Periplaneta americana TaxID=6978 RepID=A0ABQ8T2W7_PERAM|nr:hypothetical protein ANN_08426 [Periplaneta americana]
MSPAIVQVVNFRAIYDTTAARLQPLSGKNYDYAFEEMHCLDTYGSTQRADIIVFDKMSKRGFIKNSTVRFEIAGRRRL